MQRLETLPRVALVGPVNAGKSSLLNRLSGLDRSICSPIPGTTRDVLSAVMDTLAGQALLLDGPGLGTPLSHIDSQAQAAWRDLLRHVDLVLLVLPADRFDAWMRMQGGGVCRSAADPQIAVAFDAVAGKPYLLVLSKQDLLASPPPSEESVHATSAATGAGCEALRTAIGSAIADLTTTSQGRIVLTARHSQALAATVGADYRCIRSTL